MIVNTAQTIRNARATIFLSALDAGHMEFYDGAMPENGGDITDQLLIGMIDLPSPAGTVANGVFAATVGTEGQVVAEGTVTWVRLYDSADNWVMDLDVGVSGSSAAVILSATTLYVGAFVRIDHLRLIEP